MARHRLRLRLRLAPLAVLAGLVLPPSASAACPAQDGRPATTGTPELELSTLCLVNERRAAAGAPALAFDGRLGAIARAHAADMVDRGFYAHTTPDGTTLPDRLRLGGWLVPGTTARFGENLFTGSSGLGTPASTVGVWAASASHDATMLDATVDRAAVGVVAGMPNGEADGGTYVLLVGHRRPAQKAAGKQPAAKARGKKAKGTPGGRGKAKGRSKGAKAKRRGATRRAATRRGPGKRGAAT